MGDLAIQVDELSKRYRIGARMQGYRTLRESIMDSVSRPVRQLKSGGSNGNAPEFIWALDNVSFQVGRGEVIGVIGRNGAGKSTLLKILSRITRPTRGELRLQGRVGSLLEVGTGFHPELTGRENIYLNGAILGMHRSELSRKFEAIVDFAEIETFLDTPVKHFSSGMYMRLAFAVAAFLEPEILLVDEVLAVGDAAFQKKCLGKMGQVAGEGRTVLFVSHNMGAVRSLCPRSILLAKGNLIDDGPSDTVVRNYLRTAYGDTNKSGEISWETEGQSPGCKDLRLQSIRMLTDEGVIQDHFDVSEPITVELTYNVYATIRGTRIILVILTREGVLVFASTDHDQRPEETIPGRYCCRIKIPGSVLNNIQYTLQFQIDIPGFRVLVPREDFLHFSGVGNTPHGSHYPENWPGVVTPKLDWQEERIE